MDKTGWICAGTCGAFVTDKQYQNGLTKCGAEVCTLKEKPFVRGRQCAKCSMVYKEGSGHHCPAVHA